MTQLWDTASEGKVKSPPNCDGLNSLWAKITYRPTIT